MLLLLITTCLFSFVNVNKEKSKLKEAKCVTCSAVSTPKRTSRSGNYVTITWTGPLNAYFTYVYYSRIQGGTVSGTTYSTQITIDDHNEGGTISVTAHCTDNTSSGAVAGSWSAN